MNNILVAGYREMQILQGFLFYVVVLVLFTDFILAHIQEFDFSCCRFRTVPFINISAVSVCNYAKNTLAKFHPMSLKQAP